MTDKTPPEPFKFLSPLDGVTYELPPFDKALIFESMEGNEDQVASLPPASEFYSKKFTPQSRRDFIQEQQVRLGEFMFTTVLETIDAHIPAGDPARPAIIALVDALMFDAVRKIYNEWFTAYHKEDGDSPGEG